MDCTYLHGGGDTAVSYTELCVPRQPMAAAQGPAAAAAQGGHLCAHAARPAAPACCLLDGELVNLHHLADLVRQRAIVDGLPQLHGLRERTDSMGARICSQGCSSRLGSWRSDAAALIIWRPPLSALGFELHTLLSGPNPN